MKLKKLKLLCFLIAVIAINSCQEKKFENSGQTVDFHLLKKYMMIRLEHYPEKIGSGRTCYEMDCTNTSVYQLSIDQEKEFLKQVENDTINLWKKSEPYFYYNSDPIKMQDGRYLIVDYSVRSKSLIISLIEV